MGRSIEKPIKIVCGDMAYDALKEQIQCPPTTVNNVKRIPQKGREMPEGEMSIKIGYCKYEKDENGKITNVQFLKENKEEKNEEVR